MKYDQEWYTIHNFFKIHKICCSHKEYRVNKIRKVNLVKLLFWSREHLCTYFCAFSMIWYNRTPSQNSRTCYNDLVNLSILAKMLGEVMIICRSEGCLIENQNHLQHFEGICVVTSGRCWVMGGSYEMSVRFIGQWQVDF